jgi:hypothetical protein
VHAPGDFAAVDLGGTKELTGTGFKKQDGFKVVGLDNGRVW